MLTLKKMKIIDFYNSVQINNVLCFTAIVLISFFITACASNHTATSVKDVEQSEKQTTISAEEIKQYSDKQQKWLSGLQEGLSPEDSLGQVFSYLNYFFLYKENGKLFQYFQGKFPVTCMDFGLFFEDGRLTNLHLDKAVWDFQSYRHSYGHIFQYWLPDGFQEGISLVRQKNRLGDEYNDVRTACRQHVDNKGGAADVAEAIATSLLFAPLLPALVALPFLPEDKISEVPDEQLREVASKIEMGVTTKSEVRQLLGNPDNNAGNGWSYKMPYIKLRFVDGIVRWAEFWYMPDYK